MDQIIDFNETDYLWHDPVKGHQIRLGDATCHSWGQNAKLIIQDPPYNLKIGEFKKEPVKDYIHFSRKWMKNAIDCMDDNSSLYVWLGAEISDHFQPLPQFMMMVQDEFPELNSRSFITMRNQRGYGTQKNWMSVRQELLYYTKGDPAFNVQYTDIPKKTKGFYKIVGGKKLENIERSKSKNIRPGNVWHDLQQVFFLSKENVEGCYAQKPLKSIERIIEANTKEGDIVIDFFSHAGTTLLACEKLNRICYTIDISPLYCKVTLARMLHYRRTKKEGWGRKKIIQDGKICVDNETLLNY